MSTGAQSVAITTKRLLGTSDFSTNFLEYLRERIREDFEQSWANDGVYTTALGLAADGNDKFQITGTSKATDGNGNILDVDAITENSGIQFENSSGITYYIGLQHCLKPAGIQVNPRTGYPDIQKWTDYIGVRADVDAVVDNGDGTATFTITSVTESGVTHAGRKALVWKKAPGINATSEALAMEELTVAYTGGLNKITSAGDFGQTTISTTASDYEVILLGPTVRRNTDLSAVDGVCFLGTVAGVGAGSPPSVFVTTSQVVHSGDLSNLSEITRIEDSNSRMKIDVKAATGESSIDQIRVTDSGGLIKFRVDEAGNCWIEGDLTVTGTTTQEDVVTVNSSETITDTLEAGDDDATDSHLIKGTWKHTNNAESANYFYVDGASGRIGIGGLNDASHALKVTGSLQVTTQADFNDITVSGAVLTDLIPSAGTETLGDGSGIWASAHIGAVNLNSLAAIGSAVAITDDLIPDTDDTLDLGSGSKMMTGLYSHDLVLDNTPGRGVGSDLAPQADSTYSIGTATRRWANLYCDNLNFAGDFLPSADATQDIGSPTYRWVEGHFSSGLVVGYSGAVLPGAIKVGDTNFGIDYNSGNPRIILDSGEYIAYTRASNQLLANVSSLYVGDVNFGLKYTGSTEVGVYLNSDTYVDFLRDATYGSKTSVYYDGDFVAGKEWFTSPQVIQNLLVNSLTLFDAAVAIFYGCARWSPDDQLYCAVLDGTPSGTNTAMTSPDGETWTARNMPANTNTTGPKCMDISTSSGRLIVVASATGGTNRLAFSDDGGVTWSNSGVTIESLAWKSIVYSPELNRWVATNTDGTTTHRVQYSTDDGLNWSTTTSSAVNYNVPIWCNELGLFVAFPTGADDVYTSTTGASWTTQSTVLPTNVTVYDACWSRARRRMIILTNSSSHRIMYSDNGTTWSDATLPDGGTQAWGWCLFAEEIGMYVVSGTFGKIITSVDGQYWSDIRTLPVTTASRGGCWNADHSRLLFVGGNGATDCVMRSL